MRTKTPAINHGLISPVIEKPPGRVRKYQARVLVRTLPQCPGDITQIS